LEKYEMEVKGGRRGDEDGNAEEGGGQEANL
jgi:hypothetical protein